MANGYGYSGSSSSSSSSSSARQSTTNAQGQTAPPGFHYMPDGTLMSDAEHERLYGGSSGGIITGLQLDLSDLPPTATKRIFTVKGSNGTKFSLQITNEDTHYYNFNTKAFQATKTRLDNQQITSNGYSGSISFPAISDNDHYDIQLWAENGSEHAPYREVRFGNGSIDINSSTGSNSLLMQKIIYQYTNLTLTISPFSPNAVTDLIKASSRVDDTITIARGKTNAKVPFTISCEVNAATKSYRIIKQPIADDIVSFVSPTVGAIGAVVALPGENIYPAITTAADATSEGGTTVNGASTGTTVTTHVVSSTIATVGDRVLGNAALAAKTVTVQTVSAGSGKTFTISEAISIADDLPLTFSNQMNYQWPINNHVHLIKEDMSVTGSAELQSSTTISEYRDTTTILEGTEKQETIINNSAPATSTASIKPVYTDGKISTQAGNIIFNKQQKRTLAGESLRVGGYGTDELERLSGYDVMLTDLEVALTPITTTTTAACVNSTSVVVAERSGILDSVSTVSGIGIDPTAANPTVSSGAGAVSGAGTIVLSAAQNIESGATLTFANAGLVATVTGNIEILKAGDADETIRFDMEKLISIT